MPGIGTMLEAQRPDDWEITRRNQETTEKHLRPPLPNVRVSRSINTTISNATLTTLVFDTDVWDVGNMHSTTSNTDRLVAPITGLYVVTANVQWAVNATGQRQLRVTHSVSGSYAITNRMTNTDGNQALQYLAAPAFRFVKGQYATIEVYQNSGGNLNIESAGSYSPTATMIRIGGYTNEGVA